MSSLNRRNFMGGVLGFSAVAGIAGAANAESMNQVQNNKLLVLYRSASAECKAFAATLATAGVETQAIQTDLVRQWRAGLETDFIQHNKLLLGMGNWDDFTLLRGLAAEVRRFPLFTMQHSLKTPQPDWAQLQALDLLTFTQSEKWGQIHISKSWQDRPSETTRGNVYLTPLFQKDVDLTPIFRDMTHHFPTGAPSLFSWIIG